MRKNAKNQPITFAGRVRRRVNLHAKQIGDMPEKVGRTLTAPLRALPNFIIVGAQKGGTTSLYWYLRGHPRVSRASTKEVHFFDHHFQRGEWWYRSHFPLVSALRHNHAITGEASPYYLFHPHVPHRIAEVAPEARLLLCLRNPINRAISHYWHTVRRGKEKLPMAEAFRQEPERLRGELDRMLADETYASYNHHAFAYLNRGIYADQVARYLEHFDRSQLLVLRSETLFQDTEATYQEVLRFLGLEPHPLPPLPPRNVGDYRGETPEGLREELTAFFAPHNQRLYDLLGIAGPWW